MKHLINDKCTETDGDVQKAADSTSDNRSNITIVKIKQGIMTPKIYKEYEDSKLPAIELLQELGYEYLSPEQADDLRGNIKSNVILEDVLAEQLNKINIFSFSKIMFLYLLFYLLTQTLNYFF